MFEPQPHPFVGPESRPGEAAERGAAAPGPLEPRAAAQGPARQGREPKRTMGAPGARNAFHKTSQGVHEFPAFFSPQQLKALLSRVCDLSETPPPCFFLLEASFLGSFLVVAL